MMFAKMMPALLVSARFIPCAGDVIMDMLSPFIDLAELAKEAASLDAADNALAPVDDTYPLSSVELDALLQLYHECRTPQASAMRTWCTGEDEGSHQDGEHGDDVLCPRGVPTHPCTGRVLHANRSIDEDDAEFLWPWKGIRCDAFTEPTTVTHIYLPNDSLSCQLADTDLSVMVSLEQLDLSRNHLHGPFPEWLGEMAMLRLLNLQGNQLTGDIPPSFANNDALEQINLAENQLTALTLGFFDAFHRLQYLDLSGNRFALEVSRRLVASEFLLSINLSHNAFQGGLLDLPVFKFLVSFDVSSNQLTGNIPAHMSLWGREDPHDPDEDSVLAIINVSNNLITGVLPAVSNLTALQHLDVHGNNFSGSIPDFPPKLLEAVKAADFEGNWFLCPMPRALLPSNLTCVCGNGFTIQSQAMTNNGSSHGVNGTGGVHNDAYDVHLLATDAIHLCVRCPEGLYSNSTTQQKCRSCPPGSATAASSSRRSDKCSFCMPGTFANESGSQACTPCPLGAFADSVGAVSCDLCNPGEYTSGEGSANCSVCPVGTFAESKGASKCSPCLVGTYNDVEGEAKCELCPPATYQDDVGSVECKACPEGFIARYPGHVKCAPCPPGSFYSADFMTCRLCSPGTFSEAEAQTSCHNCEDGTVAESYGSEKCFPVAESGWGYKSFNGATIAVKCEPGSFNDGNWHTCRLCIPGAFAENHGSSKCSACVKGSFATSKGSLRCQDAPAGSFVDHEGAVRSLPCAPNHIAPQPGSISCTPCETPSFSFMGGVKCSTAEPGEVFEHVEWSRLVLKLPGIERESLVGDGGSGPIDVLIQSWSDTLTGYSLSVQRLHLLQIAEAETSLEIIVAVEAYFAEASNSRLEKSLTDAVHEVVGAAESKLNELLDELGGSAAGDAEAKNENEKLADLVTTSSFRQALARQFERVNLLDGALSSCLLDVSIADPPFRSTRAVPCPVGTFFSLNGSERECRPCPAGLHAATTGSLMCKPCPRGTFAAEGATECLSCPVGSDAAAGAASCVECSWFTYACQGFWEDVSIAACAGILLMRKIYKKLRRVWVGDREVQERIESEALLAAVRAHGRTFDGVQYAPMGAISADTIVPTTDT